MKICMLADGQSIHTVRWCRHFFERGHEIHLISFKDVQINDINVHFIDAGNINVSGGNWRVLLRYRQVKRIVNEIKPDVLHALYATSYGLVGALCGLHPYIITPLGTDILISPKESVFYKMVLQFAFKKADYITSMAPHMMDAMLKMGVPGTKLGELVLGINTSIFNKRNRKLPHNKFVITSTRNLEPVYNIPHLLNAIALVKSQIPNLRVQLIGDGSLRVGLEELAAKLTILDVVKFYGKVPQDKVVELLNQSHISVTVSLSDGNSLSLIEAMACGAYPIATDIPANHQWLKQDVNGSFVKINDVNGLAECIVKVYNNFDEIIGNAILASEKIVQEKGTWQVNMEKMENKYRELSAAFKN